MLKDNPGLKNPLKLLLYFGDDPSLFEKEVKEEFYKSIISENKYINSFIEIEKVEGKGQDEAENIILSKFETFNFHSRAIPIVIDVQTYISLHFLKNSYFEIEDYSWHQWIFSRILKCYLSAFTVDINDYPYRDHFIEYFTLIVKESIKLYEGIFDNQYKLRVVKNKLSEFNTNVTGYKLKPHLYPKIHPFIQQLSEKRYIDIKDREKFKEFLMGKIPESGQKIGWRKELRFLVYFINKLSEDKDGKPVYLIAPPGQPWKNLYFIFSYDNYELPDKFNERYNYLGKKSKKEIDAIFEILRL